MPVSRPFTQPIKNGTYLKIERNISKACYFALLTASVVLTAELGINL